MQYLNNNNKKISIQRYNTSSTYSKEDRTGGSNGSTMRFEKENKDPQNQGLEYARNFLETIKNRYPGISYSDLWILASYVAIEEARGPKIEFVPGRKDAYWQNKCPPNGRLPDLNKDSKHLREVFYRMGFSDKEIVALIAGGHQFPIDLELKKDPELRKYSILYKEDQLQFQNDFAQAFKKLTELGFKVF
ncbi:hypothetical protein IMG5_146260 [Ichthyophthirius multifiliis]|uniref:Plant heme peroxidase family profile domain-containing protein n=1 Tax=Ichthyophthirius multifiliis TaxID=5932 RepID=G0QXZ4_ICHMU|nr:hypothetical protein IMG5_146260 [Ichthyophthirius multifiliis]EGR29908.1 hypothetical protein IMG5_146260 [Ichthyophthirius multifiliis]|eukprot:XP_004031144.1 hypothetical protein IMG5_146260 [Ichthyophthirius multifiliis]